MTAPGQIPTVRLIVNADDFGRSEAVNSAVAQAHRQGIVTSASLMVTEEALGNALRVATENPSLSVGLHLVVLGGRAALPPAAIPHLVDADGMFSRQPFFAGVGYFFSRKARCELALEIRAQFEAFRETGLPFSHVDGHHHMHLHPTVFAILLPIAREFGVSAVRMPISDKLLFSLRSDRRHLGLKIGWKIAFAFLAAWSRRSLRAQPLQTADAVYGLMQTGCLTETYLVRLLQRVARAAERSVGRDSPPIVELFCHPSFRRESSWLGPNPGDLEAVTSPVVLTAVAATGMELTTFPKAVAARAETAT